MLPMKSISFRLSCLAAALSCTAGALAATPRTEVARPTDYSVLAVRHGPVVCHSDRLLRCGRQAAGKLGQPPGSAAKAAYRFVEEDFLFDSGVGIFLETAVPIHRGMSQLEWRRRLAFRKTAEGFQLVQVGIQYRCGGHWQKQGCGRAGKAVADGGRQAAAVAAGTAAGKAAGVGDPRPAAARTAQAKDEAVRVLDADQAAGGVRSATPVDGVSSSVGSSAVPALDARWHPRQNAIEADEAVSAQHYGRHPDAAQGADGRRGAAAHERREKPGNRKQVAGERAARAADLDALLKDEAIADQGLGGTDPAADGAPASGAADASSAARSPAASATPASADIVAANPSVSADQLKRVRDAEAALARATATPVPGVVDARHPGQPGPAADGAAGQVAPDGDPATAGQAAAARGEAAADPDARRGWQTASFDGQPARDARAPATLPSTVRTSDGFAPMVVSPEKAAALGTSCEQPIEMCGRQMFNMLFPVQASTLAALPGRQHRQESFIYADGPVTSAVYLVTMIDLPDDAIAAQRIRVEFVRQGAGWVAVSAGRQFRCRVQGGDQQVEPSPPSWTGKSCR